VVHVADLHLITRLQIGGGDRLSRLSDGSLGVDRERPLGVLPFSLPATTRLSADADFTVPMAVFAFFTSDFGLVSAGFCAGAGVVAGAGVAGAGVVV